MLETVPLSDNESNFNAFLGGLREIGLEPGRNVSIEYRSADGRGDRFPQLAAELVRLNVDVLITRGTPAALAAKSATETIPIVMAAIGEPLNTGAVHQLARPGGNVTGLSAFVTELQGKRVELLKEMVPSARRVAALLNMDNPVSAPQWEETTAASIRLGIGALLLDVRRRDDLDSVFETASREGADALTVGIDVLTQASRREIVALSDRHRLPAAYPSREFAEVGGLAAYGVHYPDLYRRAAGFVGRIIKGARPSELPVEQPTKLEFVVNLKAAQRIGLTIPPSLLARADEVIE
jgi:putative ABC transport system substrate-binding protein